MAVAATTGTAGALIGLKKNHTDAKLHRSNDHPHFTIVTVRAGERADIADDILSTFNGSDRVTAQAT